MLVNTLIHFTLIKFFVNMQMTQPTKNENEALSITEKT
jgi:hypothetical protein